VGTTDLDKLWNFITIFSSIVYEAMPFIILGAVIAGVLEVMVPQQLVAKLIPRSHVLAILIGGLLGLLFPMCECGIIPVMRRLLRKGVPLSTCTAYLLAGPIINVVVMLSTVVAFSGIPESVKLRSGEISYQMGSLWMTSLRIGLGYLVAVGTSLIVEWQYRKHGNSLLTPLARPPAKPELADGEEAAEAQMPWGKQINAIAETALHDFVDIMVFLILGALLAATVRLILTPEEIAQMSSGQPLLAIIIMMGLAVALCLCSEADAFVAASFSTLRPAAKLAFLTLGPMLDFKLYAMYTRVFRPRLIWTIFGSVIVQVFVYSTIVNYLWEAIAPRVMSSSAGGAP
jgi:uncharacterized membrane protein YraQ (UPF0718 family)